MKRKKLSILRNKHHWSQKELAEMLGVSEITVRSIENGNRSPGTKLAARYSVVFQLSVEKLFPDIFLPSFDTLSIKNNQEKSSIS